MRTTGDVTKVEHDLRARLQKDLVPLPTAQFRRRAWLQFQRALDPLAPPKPLPGSRL
jgi:hypothetical protein